MNVPSVSSVAATTPAPFNVAALRSATPVAQRGAVAAQFEAVLVRQLLGPTLTSMLGGTEGGVAGSVYGDLLADTLSPQLSAGRGLGLGRFIEQQLAPRGEKTITPAGDPGQTAPTVDAADTPSDP